MGRSRLAWAGAAVAPWGIALCMLISITAQADQEPASYASVAPRAGLATAFRSGAAELIQARFTLGSPDDLAAMPDEIEPNAALKPTRLNLPAINRGAKSDPFVVLRPGFEAHAHGLEKADLGAGDSEAGWPENSRSPARAASAADAQPITAYSDGATPGVPLDFALNSSTPRPSDGKLIVAVTSMAGKTAPPQTLLVPRTEDAPKPNYAALIDPKDSARQMRCLAEAVYFESRSEPEAGQAAVAQVVLNRVRSGIFPTDVCGVVYQDRNHPFACQFSFACEGKSLRIEEPGAWAIATRIADEVVRGVNYNPKIAVAVNYHANYVYPFWASTLVKVDRIGAHIFYAMRPGLYWAPGALNGHGDQPPTQTAAK